MSAKLNRIIKGLKEAIREANKRRTSSLDTPATVTRIDGDTMYVHMDGGVPETPVKRTIDAKVGDIVQVRAKGGQAWATGNQTAPPTDDTKAVVAETKAEKADILAKLAQKTADKAGKTATNYLSWSSEYGLVVSEDATEDVTQMEGGNTRITSDGMEVYKGQTLLAHFGRDVALYSSAGVPLVYFGYGRGESGNSGQYYTLGYRVGEVDNFSCALGYKVEASGIRSIAMNHGTIAASPNQVVIGTYNKADRVGDYALIIGNGNGYSGDVYERSNALTVEWNGSVTHSMDGTDNIISNIHRTSGATVTRCTATLYDKVCQLVLGLKYSTSVGSGENIFEGNMGGPSGYEPKAYVTGVGYYGGHAIIGRITSDGEIVVRNASSSAVTVSDEVLLSFTYVRNV